MVGATVPQMDEPLTRDQRATLLEEIEKLQGQIKGAKLKLYSPTSEVEPGRTLYKWGTFTYFAVAIVGAGVAASGLITSLNPPDSVTLSPTESLQLALIAGVFGGALSGMRSLNDRIANGWEHENGTREPDPSESKERFSKALLGGFLARPLLGAGTGVLVLAGAHAGQFETAKTLYGIMFWSTVGGLFAKTLLDKLNESFKKVLGK